MAGYSAGVAGDAGVSQGVYGQAHGGVGADGLTGRVGGFVGNRAVSTGRFDVNGVGASGTAEGWNGLGADADLNATFKKGNLRVKVGAGAALGLGGRLSGEFEVDTNEIVNGLETTGQHIETGVNQFGHEVVSGLNTAGREIESGINTAGREIETGFNTAGREVEKGVNSVGREIEKGVNSVGKGFESAGKTIGGWFGLEHGV
jgi:hypothetical protein